MKRITVVLGISTLLWACSSNSNNEGKVDEPVVEKKASLSDNPDYKKGLALVAQNDCLTCHNVDTKVNGPAYRDIAAKYAGADDATITKLAQTIIKGGSGNWGQIPMTPHPDLSEEDAKQMVKYILLLNK
jgi:cytochrome c